MKDRLWFLTVILGLLGLLAACSKSSRFDDQAVVDVCAIVDPIDVESILGEPAAPPRSESGNGFAGFCEWHFVSTSGDRNATLTVSMLTYASNAGANPNLGRWFEMNMTALKAMIDIHPKQLKGVGDRAFLFGSGAPGAILMRQSQTFLMLRTTSATAAQLEAFARLLAMATEKKGAVPAPKAPMKAVADRATQARPPSAEPPQPAAEPAQPATVNRDEQRKKDDMLVYYTVAYVEECTRADHLLRSACSRWGPQLREDLRHNCDLPAETFEARTADSYRAFKETYRERIAASEPGLSTTLARARSDFDREFAEELAGNMVGFDLERLSKLLRQECTAIEGEWLRQTK